ncbi:MAG: protein phosphatase 2C domain-containing protein [Caldilinea sp.]|nr:serine/threonine-protein phosphatase [Caldilinea sp.]MCB0146596.1 serine/threonine-protein phosphatase [Caldilineaceae bacterium]MCB9140650.1 serine/threonine-protein phosphatase [Anaerolineales bacterium]MCB0038291.1 serine/threonine-protein phosphatase [Caldilinea sp.]MCB9120399.1 serine/threonine-protein phosphatase [Caldilineaceae bacterium]
MPDPTSPSLSSDTLTPDMLVVVAMQDQGRVRERQEDSCLALCPTRSAPIAFLVVADGMGGQRGGDVASRAAVDSAAAMLRPLLGSLYPVSTLRLPGDAPESAEPFPLDPACEDGQYDPTPVAERRSLLRRSIEQVVGDANAAVRAAAASIDALDDAGCTFTLAIIVGRSLYLAHVGDSRVYLWRQAQLRQLTHDHSGAAALVAAGVVTAVEARRLPVAHQLYRFLGGTPAQAKPDVSELDLEPNDVLMICSDGLWDMLPDVEIARLLLAYQDLETLAAAMIEAANAAGGEDNISVALAHIGGDV